MKHITPEEARQLQDDPDLPYHEWVIPIGFHFMRQCKACEQAVSEGFAEWAETDPDDPRVAPVAFEFLYRQGVPEEVLARQAAIDADELLQLKSGERRLRLASEPLRFRSPALVDELVDRCEGLLTLDSEAALEVAELAVDISLRTDPDVVGSLAFHSRARAAAHQGNCLRILNHRPTARQIFHRARTFYEEAVYLEPEIQAEICYLEASLAIDQRRFAEARHLLGCALEVYRQTDEPRLVALTLLKRAHAAYQRGEPLAGLDDLHEAASLLDPKADRRHHLMIRFNLVLYAVEAGDVERARRAYDEHHELLESHSEPWFALRLLWLRAKMARAEGHAQAARDLYARAREGFLAEGSGYDAALVSLELALLDLEGGDLKAVKRLATEMLPVFKAQDVHREALAALALFRQAAHAEELTLELATCVHRYLQLARADTSLKFQEFRADSSHHE